MSRLTVLLLGLMSVTAFAGNYADKGTEASPQNNKVEEQHFYIDLGASEYYFNQPSMGLPLSTGFGDVHPASGPVTPFPNTSGASYDADNWAFAPSITLGYQFLTDNSDLQAIFGQQNAIELRGSYFHNTGSQSENYTDQPYYVNPAIITGVPRSDMYTSSYDMTNSTVDFDNTYENIGLYYTGNKVISNSLINSPYVGVDVSYLKQDSNYNADLYLPDSDNGGKPDYSDPDNYFDYIGSDNLSSYYMGLAFGDKATYLFEKNYGVYGELGAGVYWMHTKLSASQTPAANQPDVMDQTILGTYTVDTSDDQATFKLNAEVGLNYYFKSNQDQMSPRVTLLAGLDYWNDVAYADNPTEDGQMVKIAYDSAVNPYAGLQLHIPL
ncbi:MAG: hypothetical protein V4496_03620 [Pseudomonadota bacterium]